jgi:hypothetical protein
MVKMTAGELARFLGCGRSTISRWMSAGLPYQLDGLSYTYELESVLKWLAGRSERHRRFVQDLHHRIQNEGHRDVRLDKTTQEDC